MIKILFLLVVLHSPQQQDCPAPPSPETQSQHALLTDHTCHISSVRYIRSCDLHVLISSRRIFSSFCICVLPDAVFSFGLHGCFLMRRRFLERLFFHFSFLSLLYFFLFSGSCRLFSVRVNDRRITTETTSKKASNSCSVSRKVTFKSNALQYYVTL